MKKKFIIAFLITLLAGVSALAVETDGKYLIVDVDGQGENRLDAIETGLVEALRLASGSFIDSKTEMNNEELKRTHNILFARFNSKIRSNYGR